MIEEDVRERLAEKDMIGARPFEIRAAPFRKWQLRLFTMDRRRFIDLELDAAQINLGPKAFTRRVLAPALEIMKQLYRNAA